MVAAETRSFSMNNSQWSTVVFGIVLIIGSCFYVPWETTDGQSLGDCSTPQMRCYGGYSWILEPPPHCHPDIRRLLIGWVVIASLTVLIVIVNRDEKIRPKKAAARADDAGAEPVTRPCSRAGARS